MRKAILTTLLVTLTALAAFAAPDKPPSQVEVTNFPPVQDVQGVVSVDNLPAVQEVDGAIEVTNLPAVQDVNVVSAGTCRAPFQLLGFTSGTVLGDVGIFALNRACQADYPGSRMCTSQEVMDTTVIPTVLSGSAWVRPTFVPVVGAVTSDISGFTSSESAINFTCTGWSTTFDRSGLSVRADGIFSVRECADPDTSVARSEEH